MKLDVEAEGFSKELEEIKAGKIKDEEKKTKPILQVDLGKGVKLEMVLIPAGKFMTGSPASEKGRNENETQHEVRLTKPFYMGKYEVTQEQWQAVMGNNPSTKTKGAKLPVTNVSWNDCQDYIKKLNAKTNGGYRLPTEAEWEYACRAGTKTAYAFGDSITKSDVSFGKDSTMVVGSYKNNFLDYMICMGMYWNSAKIGLNLIKLVRRSIPKGHQWGKLKWFVEVHIIKIPILYLHGLQCVLVPEDRLRIVILIWVSAW